MRSPNSRFVMPALVAGIQPYYVRILKDGDGRDIRAFTPVFDGLCPAMASRENVSLV